MESDTILIIVLSLLVVIFIVIAILGSRHHVYKAKFNPEFRRLSDGSLQMEVTGFGGIQTARTKRFYEEYSVGREVEYCGRRYRIVEIKEVPHNTIMKPDIKMIAYLEEL